MKNKKYYFLAICILLQISIIVYLLLRINVSKKDILGKVIINPIQKDTVINNPSSTLHYYYEPKPNVVEIVNEWGPHKGKYTINKDSLNERFDYDEEKPVDTFRIITLGDSYTYGLYVDTKDNWSEKVEDLLIEKCDKSEKYEVINLGVHGYDIEHALERFRLRGAKYHPDLVIWFIKSDDSVQLNEVMGKKIASYSPTEGYSNWNRAMQETIAEVGKENILKFQLNNIEKFIDSYSQKTIFMTFPEMKAFPDKQLKAIVDSHKDKVDLLYIKNIYKNKDLFYPNDFHPTPKGHTSIAEDIYEYLNKNNFISCK